MTVLDAFRLDDRIAFISGAAGHLGRETAFALGEAGAHLNGRNDARLQAFASKLATRGIGAECAAFDMMDFPAVQRFLRAVRSAEAAGIRSPILFLASSSSSFVTGTVLAADGGWTAW